MKEEEPGKNKESLAVTVPVLFIIGTVFIQADVK
jgi:hypothetical protein